MADEETTWVVGVDGSDHARRALEWAAHQAEGHGAAIDAVSAWQYPYAGVLPMAGEALPAFDEEAGQAVAAQAVEVAAAVAAETGASIKGRAELGTPAEVVLDAAADADMVVVGSRGRGGFRRLILGSVSHQVACHATVPTVIVPERAPSVVRRALVGVDGSDNAMAAMTWLHEFIPADAELIALGAWDVGYLGSEHSASTVLAELKADTEDTFNAAVDRFEAEVAPERTVTREFMAGYPGERLVARAADADLVAVGARGHRGVAAALLGSTTTWVIHHLACPTAVIPAGS